MAYSSDIRVVEENIVSLLRNKDLRGMELLYDRYGSIIYGFIYQALKSDEKTEQVMEEVMLNTWRFNENFNSKKERLFTWIINMARNKAIDKIKSSEHTVNTNAGTHYNPESEAVKAKLLQLEKDQLTLIEEIYFMGKNVKVKDHPLDFPVSQVKGKIREALKTINS